MARLKIPSLEAEFEVAVGERMSDLAEALALPIEIACCAGSCGTCAFRIVTGSENLSAPSRSELRYFSVYQPEPDVRLACQCKVHGDISIEPLE